VSCTESNQFLVSLIFLNTALVSFTMKIISCRKLKVAGYVLIGRDRAVPLSTLLWMPDILIQTLLIFLRPYR